MIVNMRDLQDDAARPAVRASRGPDPMPQPAPRSPSPPPQLERRDSDGLLGAAANGGDDDSSSSSSGSAHSRSDSLSSGEVPQQYSAAGSRRKSVFVEPYNPEEDEDDEKPVSQLYSTYTV